MAQTKRERFRAKIGRRKQSELLTGFVVAKRLGISQWCLLVWRRQRKGPPFIRLGPNSVRYPEQILRAWLASLPRN